MLQTFPYYDIYLGLVSVFDAEFGETEGRVHLRLSWSPDAETWHWVDPKGLNGRDMIALGSDGAGGGEGEGNDANAFDSHIIFAAAYPIKQDDGDVRVYYVRLGEKQGDREV